MSAHYPWKFYKSLSPCLIETDYQIKSGFRKDYLFDLALLKIVTHNL